jgi:UPF0755 protein
VIYLALQPYQGFAGQTFVEIDRGMTSSQIASRLAEQGIIRSRWTFLALRAVRPRARLEAGEYRFASPVTPWQVFEKIRRGEVFYEDFTVPEGSNIFDIAALLEQSDTVPAAEFVKAAADPSLIRDLDPQAPGLEGYLFPSTYRVTHRTTARQLCRTMTNEFRKRWQAAGGPEAQADVHRTVTLASLVEKETALPDERPLVASVFTNRLAAGMALQCDPTTVYAALLENRYRGVIYRSDLTSSNPYNTYTHTGLPPGPIANPGEAAIRAALHPAQSSYLYFVATGGRKGMHHFSTSLSEHEKAVAEFRKSTR